MPGQDGFAIGVDLGTSNTVAVIRWPDGRTRPLLVDGVPIMPSGVYLDESGRLLVGRDAERLAQLEPARFEPNPKRRIDEAAVLLGDREVAVVDLLAAVLGAVARGAVEAVGFLPPAVLTFPAAWGQRRRDTVAAAAGRAGWPPVRLLPEPVAAARYFADVLRRPVPVGASLAVFDFGGGTLDVAVVRNAGGGFEVLGSGGIPDLGGLDVDAALVEHLGAVLGANFPVALTRPRTATERRARRLFWEDVRGAKEMLSRTTVAPVAVPGLEQAVHLTRDELDRIATPLLRRAVYETAVVIQRCGLRPDQLAGLFLVGGSSRLPVVARLLHADLGVAPTVLEQPELPVAEGALAEIAPLVPAPTSAPPVAAPISPPPAHAGPPGAQPAATPPPAPAPQRRPFWRSPWVLAAAGALVLALVATVAVVVLYRPSRAVEFTTLDPLGTTVPIDDPSSVSYTFSGVSGDRGYVGYVHDKTFKLGTINLGRGRGPSRTTDVGEADLWTGLVAFPNGVVITGERDSHGVVYVMNPDTGAEQFHTDVDRGDHLLAFDAVLVVATDSKGTRGLDWKSGTTKWVVPPLADSSDTRAFGMSTVADLGGPAAFDGTPYAPDLADDTRLLQVTSDRTLRVYDVRTGRLQGTRLSVGRPDDGYLAHDGALYAVNTESPYQIQSYALGKLGEPQIVYTAHDPKRRWRAVTPCGSGRVCLLDSVSSDDKTTEIVAIDVAGHRELWRRPAPNADTLVPVGDRIMAVNVTGEPAAVLYDPDGKQLLKSGDQHAVPVRITSGSLLLFSESPSSYPTDTSLVGVGSADGGRTAVGQLTKLRSKACSWNERFIVCPTDKEFQAWRFAK